MEWLVFWLVMATIVTLVALSKGRSGFVWFIYGLAIWPIALVHILVTRRTAEKDRLDAAWAGRVPCPHCREMIIADASVCRFCGRDVAHADATAGAWQSPERGGQKP